VLVCSVRCSGVVRSSSSSSSNEVQVQYR